MKNRDGKEIPPQAFVGIRTKKEIRGGDRDKELKTDEEYSYAIPTPTHPPKKKFEKTKAGKTYSANTDAIRRDLAVRQIDLGISAQGRKTAET